MKKIKIIIVAVIIVRLISLAMFGCSSVIDPENPDVVTITSTEIDDSLHLIVSYSDGSTKDMGYVGVIDESLNVVVTKTEVTSELHLIVTFSNNTQEDLGYIGVVDESRNVIVTKTEVNSEKHLIVTYSNGTTEDKGYVGVIDESLNVKILSSIVNNEKHLIVTYSNGTVEDLGYVGVVDESLNVVITKTEINDEKHLIVTYSNGTTEDKGYVGVVDESLNIVVTKTEVNSEKHLIVTYSNGNVEDKGYVGVIDESLNVVVTKSEVNEELHLIVTYSNGTTEDLGYVGVEVIPPLYKVRFLDINGNLITEQEVYKGRSAKAPTAPTVADKKFVGWDKEYTDIQGDVDIKAVYSDNDSYTVTFKKADGTVLKTQSVMQGHGATAPNVSNTTDEIFTGWDKTYNNIQADTVVIAQFRAKKTYTVTFKDYSGVILGTSSVKELDGAVAPVTPTRDGYTFTGWSSSISSITSNKMVTAQYSLNSGNNIVDLSYSISGTTLTVVIAMKGTVKFCGLEGEITIPSGLTYSKSVDGDGTVSNYSDGKIYLMFSSNNGQNVTTGITITTLTFTIGTDAPNSVALSTTISDIYDQEFVDVSCKVIGQTIRLN